VVVGGLGWGGGGAARAAPLRARLAPRGVEIVAVEPVMRDGEPVSSTRVRRAIADGDLEAAERLLGRPYVLEGDVVQGDRRGRTLGFPTANLDAPGRALPASGVYAAFAASDEPTWRCVVNVGVRPTFGGDPAPRAEVHVLGRPGDLYGRTMRVAFVRRLREERRFAGLDELVARIERDREQAEAALSALDGASLRGPGF
jgi:riboflavin kinase/FMN adenylyltransferase